MKEKVKDQKNGRLMSTSLLFLKGVRKGKPNLTYGIMSAGPSQRAIFYIRKKEYTFMGVDNRIDREGQEWADYIFASPRVDLYSAQQTIQAMEPGQQLTLVQA